MDSKIDRRKNAEPYKKGVKPSAKSEYFGKSYGQLKRESAKGSALKKKTSADHINGERKRQGYKPMSAKDKRIHDGMDKYL